MKTKLSEVLKNALSEAMPTAAELIASANRRKKPAGRWGGLEAAVVVMLLCVSVSAAIVYSGFNAAFGVSIDTGEVTLVNRSDNASAFSVDVNEIWFDEYNLYIGGTVTTPVSLDPDGSHEILVEYSVNGGESGSAGARVYPSGTPTSAFVLSMGQRQGENGWERIGVTGDTAEISLLFTRLCDWSLGEGEGHIDDFTTYMGGISLVLEARSAAKAPLFGEKDGIRATLNPFTLELTGELGQFHTVFVRMGDGTLIGHEQGEVSWLSRTENGYLMTFTKPVDLTEAVAVVVVEDWYILPGEMGEEVILPKTEIPLG